MAIYIPRVLICGDVEDFKKKIGSKPVEIVGQIKFDKTDDDINLFFGEQNLTKDDITKLLDGSAEYLIFVDTLEFYYHLKKFPHNASLNKFTTVSSRKKCFLYSTACLNIKKFLSTFLTLIVSAPKATIVQAEIQILKLIAWLKNFIRLWKMFTGKFIVRSMNVNFTTSTEFF